MSSNMSSGWFAVKRGTLDHELFTPIGKWSRYEAWVWMIESAAYRPTTIDIGGKPYTVPRGALCFSLRFMSEKFKWSRKAVTTFLEQLEAHGVITCTVAKTGTGSKSKRSQITLCNYEKYQSAGAKTEPKESQNGAKEEQVTNIPPTEGASAPVNPDAVMFAAGKDLLAKAGKSAADAGKLLGKWRKDHGTEAVISAIGRAQREGAIDPVSFIAGCLRFSNKQKASHPEIGDVREFGGIRKQYAGNGAGWLVLHD